MQSAATWTRVEDKMFEQALVLFPDGDDRWQRIASRIPGKSALDVIAHFEALVHDVSEIDSGRVELPSYPDDSFGWDQGEPSQISFGNSKKQGEAERNHRLFLIGLDRYGKGDWRSISRNVVVTRTPTQVASHAQKYYLRQQSMKKERKRSSIHDITTAVDTKTVPPQTSFANQGGVGGGGGYHQNYNFPTQG
nr:transcription factor DIVARICATA-like [Ipomoea batatas]